MNAATSLALPELPDDLVATEPPEARGLERDQVRLMVASPDGIEHATFRYLPRFLRAGDLVVVNTSATIPAAIDATRAGAPIVVHFATHLDDGRWTVELRRSDGAGPFLDGRVGETIELAGGASLELVGPYSGPEGRSRIVVARFRGSQEALDHLARHGRPITYGYLRDRWPLAMYQTVFAAAPGSAEMPSAGRPFTAQLIADLVKKGVIVAPLTLHTGVSSLELREPPLSERMTLPATTADLVNHTRAAGGRVVAVGTTVTRALESAAGPDGVVAPFDGWTDLVLGPERPARVVDALITGWHPPEASHQLLLEAVAGPDLLSDAYRSALRHGYLWHEFGDSCLLLPR